MGQSALEGEACLPTLDPTIFEATAAPVHSDTVVRHRPPRKRLLAVFLGAIEPLLSSIAEELDFALVFVEIGNPMHDLRDLHHSHEAHSAALRSGGRVAVDPSSQTGCEVLRRLVESSDCLVHGLAGAVAVRLGMDPRSLKAMHPSLTVIRLCTSLQGLTAPVAATLRSRLSDALVSFAERHGAGGEDGSGRQDGHYVEVSTADVESARQVASAYAAVKARDGRVQVPLALLSELAQAFAPELVTGRSGHSLQSTGDSCAAQSRGAASYTELRVALSARLRAPGGPTTAELLDRFPEAIAL